MTDTVSEAELVETMIAAGDYPSIAETLDLEEYKRRQAAANAPSRFAATLLRRSQLRDLPPVEPLIDGVLSRRSAAVLVGSTGAGKTFVALSWACSVGTGTQWLGCAVEQCPALYVVGEGAHGLDSRVEAWERTWGVQVTDDNVVFSIKPASLAGREVWEEMTAEARALGARFIILDTFSSLAPDADETKDAATITRRMSDLSAAVDGTTLLVHHPGWGDAERTRGGYQLEANVDEVLLLRGNASSDLISLERKKVKEGPAGAQMSLRRRPAHGSVIIEAVSGVERTELAANDAERVARQVFADQVFSQAQLRDALMERLDLSRTTAYEDVRKLVVARRICRAGGTDARPTFQLAEAL